MTTGDLKNNLRKFDAELKLINYASELDIEGLSIGRPSAFLPILHFVLTEFSIELAQYFYSKDYELLGKSDKNFVSVIYRILRDEFNTKPPLTREQFFTLGFAERKLQFATTVIQLCRRRSDMLKPKKKKTMLRSNAAITSKMNIQIPDRASSIGTKNSAGTTSFQATSLVTMPTDTSSVSHSSKPGIDNTVVCKQGDRSSRSGSCFAYKPDNPLCEGQALKDDLDLTIPDDGSVSSDQNGVPRSRSIEGHYFTRVEKNIASRSVQFAPETLSRINPLLQQETNCDERYKEHSSNGHKNDHAAKENICPNSGNGLIIDGDNVDDVFSYNKKSYQRQNIVLSPIPVTNKMTFTGLDYHSERQGTNDGQRPSNMPIVNYSETPECSKHIFVTQPSMGTQTPLRVEALDVLLPDKHSQEVAEILDYVKQQDKRINALEEEVEERNNRIEELVATNSNLAARVMVLETAVALIQEKLES